MSFWNTVIEARRDVISELLHFGFYTGPVRRVSLRTPLVLWSAFGTFCDDVIEIPVFNLWRTFGLGVGWSIKDTLRHEYGHAVFAHHETAMRRRGYQSIFERNRRKSFHRDHFATEHAVTDPEEDFCETFFPVLAGIDTSNPGTVLEEKFDFVRSLGRALRNKA
jgi:hypothetical protein